jgi:hypothetical protein
MPSALIRFESITCSRSRIAGGNTITAHGATTAAAGRAIIADPSRNPITIGRVQIPATISPGADMSHARTVRRSNSRESQGGREFRKICVVRPCQPGEDANWAWIFFHYRPSMDRLYASGSPDTFKRPVKGSSISMIRNTAPATDKALIKITPPTTTLRGANRPKLKKIAVAEGQNGKKRP